MATLVNDPKLAELGDLPAPKTAPPVSVIILTHNEERNIAACLESCNWCDDVHVLDSGSTDRTREIAAAHGAQVHVHPFGSFASQRNWAIDHIAVRYPWQFHLDADERFTSELVREINKELGSDGSAPPYAAYKLRCKTIFMDKWLRHSGVYPKYQVRLFRTGRCRFVDFAQTQREEVRGEIGSLVQPYLHYSVSNGMAEWFYKHNRYSSGEADAARLVRSGRPRFAGLFSGDSVTRRRTLRQLSYYVKFRGFFRFLYMYIVRAGWLDATPGFHYCAMMATYEYWIELKIQEHDLQWSQKTTDLARRLLEQRPSKRSS